MLFEIFQGFVVKHPMYIGHLLCILQEFECIHGTEPHWHSFPFSLGTALCLTDDGKLGCRITPCVCATNTTVPLMAQCSYPPYVPMLITIKYLETAMIMLRTACHEILDRAIVISGGRQVIFVRISHHSPGGGWDLQFPSSWLLGYFYGLSIEWPVLLKAQHGEPT